MSYFEQSSAWIEKAASLRSPLRTDFVVPFHVSEIVPDANAFAGWKTEPKAPPDSVTSRSWNQGESFILDFGDHHVGYFQFSLEIEGEMDAPVRLRLVFAERPVELAEPFDPYMGSLARSWLQDEVVTLDLLSSKTFTATTLPRRFAFRYVRVEIVAVGHYRLRIKDLACRTVTSADDSCCLPPALPPFWIDLDRISQRTLRNCMQEVFEDGTKRDRRLWMGDLRLQALTNAVTFRNFGLVKRCLYLFAGLTTEEGRVNGCVYEHPEPHGSGANPLDYAVIFGATLREYLAASQDSETAEELWPVALRQLDFALSNVRPDGTWHNAGHDWIFIDWSPELKKEAAFSGLLAFAIRQVIGLAQEIGRSDDAAFLTQRLEKLVEGTRRAFWDQQAKRAICEGQVSWLTQAWFVLGEILSPDEGKAALQGAMADSSAVRPASPYGSHFVIEALLECGMTTEASRLLREFWGGMAHLGADTFWEIWVPEDHRASPYGNHLLNSSCHAWSCTPAYFLRRWPSLATAPID